MTALRICLLPFFITVFTGCGQSEEEPVMRNDSIFQAYIRDVDGQVKSVEAKLTEMLRYEFDSLDFRSLSTEYPYWKNLDVYLDENGIRKAKLYANYDKGRRTEEFYFRNGNLIYGRINENGLLSGQPETEGEEFYFTEGKLIFALDNSGNQKNVKDDSVKIKGIDLVNEARQIQEIIATKDIRL